MFFDNKIAFTAGILLFLAFAAYGQTQERVAIIQTLDDRDSLGVSDLAYLTDKLRETAVKVLPRDRFGVMTTESIVAFLGSQERAIKICRESSCLAELGRQVSADFVAQGHIGRFGTDLTIKVELYNVKTGNLIGSFTGDSKNMYGLRDIINENAPDLFKNMLATAPPPPQPPPPPPQQQPIATEAPVAEQIIDEPYTPPFVPADDTAESDYVEENVKRKLLTFGVMAGINLSHITINLGKAYGDAVGVQLGAVADFAPFNWLRFQPGIMYIQKGFKDKGGSITAHYFEFPLLLSFKISAFRLNAGPYFGYCLGSGYDYVFDSTEYGVSAGIGFDIGRYYIGMFYDYGVAKKTDYIHLMNNTLGFNFGMNL